MHIELYIRLGFEDNTPTPKEIKLAYRSKSKECHPDLFPDDKAKHALFLSITEAYEILMDEAKREEYDNSGFILSNNEERAIRTQAIKNILETITKVIEGIPENQFDMVNIKDLTKSVIRVNQTQINKEITTREAFIKKMNKAVDNFKYKGAEENIISQAAAINIKEKQAEILELNKAHKVMEAMIDILDNYDYETIKTMHVVNHNTASNFRGFVFTNGIQCFKL